MALQRNPILDDVAHELFHAFELGFPYPSSCSVSADKWFWEGAAVWGAWEWEQKYDDPGGFPYFNTKLCNLLTPLGASLDLYNSPHFTTR